MYRPSCKLYCFHDFFCVQSHNSSYFPLIFNVIICDVLHDLLPFVQFKKRENTQWSMLDLEKLQA